MQTLYDIVISVALGGIILGMLVAFNGNITQNAVAQQIKLMTQTNLTEVAKDLDYELRKMGYLLRSLSDSSIVIADSNRIKFKGDFDNNGSVDTLVYYLDTQAASGHANPNTRILYRTLNSNPARAINIGITRFRFWYYDANGNPFTTYPVARPSLIKSIKAAINVESTVPYILATEKYVKLNPGVYWERSFKPTNLR